MSEVLVFNKGMVIPLLSHLGWISLCFKLSLGATTHVFLATH